MIQPDKVAFRAGINRNITRPVIRMRFHESFAGRTTQAAGKSVRVDWAYYFLFQTDSPGATFVDNCTKVFATNKYSEATGAIKNWSSIEFRSLKAV